MYSTLLQLRNHVEAEKLERTILKQLWTGLREIARLIRYANYLVLAKTDLDTCFCNKQLEKTDEYILRPSANWNKAKKANRWCSKATQLLQSEKRYWLIIITGATFICIFSFRVN